MTQQQQERQVKFLGSCPIVLDLAEGSSSIPNPNPKPFTATNALPDLRNEDACANLSTSQPKVAPRHAKCRRPRMLSTPNVAESVAGKDKEPRWKEDADASKGCLESRRTGLEHGGGGDDSKVPGKSGQGKGRGVNGFEW